MKSGIVLDKWKRKTFRRVLKAHGIRWKELGKIPDCPNCVAFEVTHKAKDLPKIREIVQECQDRSYDDRRNSN